jgi:hypothetical protein
MGEAGNGGTWSALLLLPWLPGLLRPGGRHCNHFRHFRWNTGPGGPGGLQILAPPAVAA